MSKKSIKNSSPGSRILSRPKAASQAFDDGVFKIDSATAIRRTKRMVAWDTGLTYNQISTAQDLATDLKYTPSNKKNLEGPIEEFWFADVAASADPDDLAEAKTVGDLASRIFTKYVPKSHRK